MCVRKRERKRKISSYSKRERERNRDVRNVTMILFQKVETLIVAKFSAGKNARKRY